MNKNVRAWIVTVLISLVFIMTGCATGPYGEDYWEYLSRPVFADNFNGKITVDDQTSYKKGQSNFRENPKLEIIDEIRRGQRNVIEDNPKTEFHFTYYRCEEKGLFPTQSEPLNVLIAVGTLGIWPIGTEKVCRVDLEIKDITTGKIVDSFTSTTEERSGGSIYQYLPGARGPRMSKASWGLPARRLLLQYQENLKLKSNP